METLDNNFGAPFSKLCRTCLRPKKGMKPIYDSNITNLLMFGASIKVESGDGMPGNICLMCLRQVYRSCSFKNLCEKSDSILKRYVMYGCLPPEDFLKVENSQQETRIMDERVDPVPEEPFVNDTANLLNIKAFTNSIPDHFSEDEEGALKFLELGLEPECNLIENALAAMKGSITLTELPDESDSLWLQQTDSIVLEKGVLDVGKMITFSMITEPDDDFIHILPGVSSTNGAVQDHNYSLKGCIRDNGNNKNKEKTIPCPECSEKFGSPVDLKLHMSIHSLDGPFQCNACDKHFSKKYSLVKHVRRHMDCKGHKCQMCNKVFTSPAQLSKHTKRHSVWRASKYVCLTCGKVYQDPVSLANHTRRHTGEKPYSCPHCSKTFSDNRLLASHIRTQKNEKQHECLVCDKKFNHGSSLSTHMRTHTGEKPYVCNICSKAFIQSSNLSLHMRTHTGERPYSCAICSKSFASSSTLTHHVRIHTGKAYPCGLCSKAFSRSVELTLHHKRVHSNERPFGCTLCDKKFVTASHKNQHMLSHVEKLNKNCGICGKDCTIKAHGKIKNKRKTKTIIQETVNENVSFPEMICDFSGVPGFME